MQYNLIFYVSVDSTNEREKPLSYSTLCFVFFPSWPMSSCYSSKVGWVDIFDIFLDIAAINKNWEKKIPGPIIACNNGVSRALKGVKNAVHMVLFPFKPSLFPTDETLVDSLLKACDSMTHNTKCRRQLQN